LIFIKSGLFVVTSLCVRTAWFHNTLLLLLLLLLLQCQCESSKCQVMSASVWIKKAV
jgi:hypothetical protein